MKGPVPVIKNDWFSFFIHNQFVFGQYFMLANSTYSEGGSSNGVGIGSRTERIHLFQDNFWNLQNFTFYCPWHEACLSRISYSNVLEMLLYQGMKQTTKATKMVEKVTVRLFSRCFVWPTTL